MPDAVEEFTLRILKRYEGVMDAAAFRLAQEDLDTGEFAVAAISAVEMAPVNDDEIDELMRLAEGFVGADALAAPLVAQKARARFHAIG